MLIVATATVVLSSCDGKMSPHAYNEAIVQMHTESWDYLNPRMEQIYDYENTLNEDAKLLIDSLNTKYDGYIKHLNEMKYPDVAADWHKLTTQLFVYVKDSVIPLYSEALNYKPESEEWYRVWNEIDYHLKGRASEIEDQAIKEQKKFAATAGEKLR
jgi:hypothetical protein